MKPNPAGSSPEACKDPGRAERSCPVCQGWGGASGLGSESKPGPGPGAASGPGPGPAATSGPGLRPSTAPGPGLGPGVVPEAGPGGPGAVSGPGATSGPGPSPQPGPGAGSVPGPGAAPSPGLRQGSGTAPKASEPMAAPPPAPPPKSEATTVQAPRQKVLVTGGGGYLGFSLGSSLARSGTAVVLLDLRRPQWELPPGTEFLQVQWCGSWGVREAGGGGGWGRDLRWHRWHCSAGPPWPTAPHVLIHGKGTLKLQPHRGLMGT